MTYENGELLSSVFSVRDLLAPLRGRFSNFLPLAREGRAGAVRCSTGIFDSVGFCMATTPSATANLGTCAEVGNK